MLAPRARESCTFQSHMAMLADAQLLRAGRVEQACAGCSLMLKSACRRHAWAASQVHGARVSPIVASSGAHGAGSVNGGGTPAAGDHSRQPSNQMPEENGSMP